MSRPEIRAALDTSVVMRLLTGQAPDLATVARSYMAEIEQTGAKVFVSNRVVMEAYIRTRALPVGHRFGGNGAYGSSFRAA